MHSIEKLCNVIVIIKVSKSQPVEEYECASCRKDTISHPSDDIIMKKKTCTNSVDYC